MSYADPNILHLSHTGKIKLGLRSRQLSVCLALIICKTHQLQF